MQAPVRSLPKNPYLEEQNQEDITLCAKDIILQPFSFSVDNYDHE